MRVGLALEIDSSFDRLAPVVAEIDQALKIFFSDKEYGNDVENIFVGIVLTGPGSERIHPVRKLSYKKMHKIRIPGRLIELRNVIQYDIKPDFKAFHRANVEEVRQLLMSELVRSLDILEQHRTKFPKFDSVRFAGDMKDCLDHIKRHDRLG